MWAHINKHAHMYAHGYICNNAELGSGITFFTDNKTETLAKDMASKLPAVKQEKRPKKYSRIY